MPTTPRPRSCRKTQPLLALLVLALVSGCSATVQLRPPTVPVLSKLPNEKIAVVQFADQVPEDNRVGRMKNLYQATIRWVTLKPPVAVTLSESIADILNRSGMDAELLQTATVPEGRLVLTGQVKNMSLTSRPGWSEIYFDAMVQFDAQLKQPDGSVVSLGQIEGSVNSTTVGGVGFTMEQSLSEAMGGAIADGVRKLLDQLKSRGLLTS